MQIDTPEAKAIWNEMQNASERTQAIVAASFLEDKLTELILAHLRQDKDTTDKLFDPGKPLGTLGTKCDVGYLLGFYSKEFRKDIATIGKIRNRFAHWARPTTFDTPEIRTFCEALGLQRRIFRHSPDDLQEERPLPPGMARFIFISTIDIMSGHIIEMTRNPNHPRVL